MVSRYAFQCIDTHSFIVTTGNGSLLACYTQHNWVNPIAGSRRHSLTSKTRHKTLYRRTHINSKHKPYCFPHCCQKLFDPTDLADC